MAQIAVILFDYLPLDIIRELTIFLTYHEIIVLSRLSDKLRDIATDYLVLSQHAYIRYNFPKEGFKLENGKTAEKRYRQVVNFNTRACAVNKIKTLDSFDEVLMLYLIPKYFDLLKVFLLLAVRQGNIKLVSLLFVNYKSLCSSDLFDAAIVAGHVAMLEYLLGEFEHPIELDHLTHFLFLAIKAKQYNVIEYLFTLETNSGHHLTYDSLLRLAIDHEDEYLITYALKHNAKVPLRMIGNYILAIITGQYKVDKLILLLECGADVEYTYSYMMTHFDGPEIENLRKVITEYYVSKGIDYTKVHVDYSRFKDDYLFLSKSTQ